MGILITQNKVEVGRDENFIWKTVTDEAYTLFEIGCFELYSVNSDDIDSLIESTDEIKEAIENGDEICIEVGHIKPMEVLKKQGYYVNNLYTLEDVTNRFDVTDEGAEKVLDATFNSEYVASEINFFINENAESMGYSELEILED